MDPVLDMQTDVVHGAGRHVASLSKDAEELTSALLTDVEVAADEIRHPVVAKALTTYRTEWIVPAAFTLHYEIQKAGSNISGSAVTVDEADRQVESDLRHPQSSR
jgi:hypothetical protein